MSVQPPVFPVPLLVSKTVSSEPSASADGPALPKLLSTAEVAAWIGRSERTVRGWAKAGLIVKTRFAGKVGYLEADVLDALKRA